MTGCSGAGLPWSELERRPLTGGAETGGGDSGARALPQGSAAEAPSGWVGGETLGGWGGAGREYWRNDADEKVKGRFREEGARVGSG